MPSKVLLPTPDPAKIPIRWPVPTVNIPSIALTPTSKRSSIGGRVNGLGGSCSVGTVGSPLGNNVPSIGFPIESSTLPISSAPTLISNGARVPSTKQPVEISRSEV